MQRMKLLRKFACICLAFGLIGLQSACKKETDNYDLFPMQLSIIDTLGSVKLRWTKIETADFIEYLIVRSNKDSIPNFSALTFSNEAVVIARVTNSKVNEAIDFSGTSLTNRVYYRAFARLKNRTISSANKVSNSDIAILNITAPSEVIQDDNNPNLVYLNAGNVGQITLYDLSKDSIVAQSSSVGTSSRIALASDRGNNAEIVQILNSSRKIVFRDAKTLDIKFNMNFTNSIYSGDGGHDGFICISTDDYSKFFQTIRLSDHKYVSSVTNNIDNTYFYSYGNLVTKIPNTNEYLVSETSSSSPNLAKLTCDAQGVITQAKLIGKIQNTSSSSLISRVSSKGNYYFLYGQIYSNPIDVNKPLNFFLPNTNSTSDFVFKQDESKFYILRQSFNSSISNVLEEYSLSTGKLVRSISTRLTGRLVLYKDKAYIFGTSNSSSQQTLIQKIQL
jgi:hypothetical protein